MTDPSEDLDMSAAPEACPGPYGETAGSAGPCAGCPNQRICASGDAKTEDPDIPAIRARMQSVKHKILVLSGKGGVGKSTVSALLARALAARCLGMDRNVALVDIDICGPSQPTMMGLEGEAVHQSMQGWSPLFVEENLCTMSVGFLLGSPDDAVAWRGPRKNGIIKQFLKDVDWGDIEYMVVDAPPGTSDEHLSVVQFLQQACGEVDGAVVVTTPQEVALLDVRKEIDFCRKLKVPILGVVENMAGFVCPKCTKPSEVFRPSTGGAAELCKQFDIDLLGRIPLDPRIAQNCDAGKNFLEEVADSPSTIAYLSIVDKLTKKLESR